MGGKLFLPSRMLLVSFPAALLYAYSRRCLNNSAKNLSRQSFFAIASSRVVVTRAIKVAMIVGTILAFINHGDKILNFSLSNSDWFKVVLTYLVPYGVSTWSAVGAIKASASLAG